MKKGFQLFKPSPFKVGLFTVIFACLLYRSFCHVKPPLLISLDNQVTDAMFRWRGPQKTTGSVAIVDIDEKSLRRVGQWPWPRNVVADLIRRINGSSPRAIGLDIVFAEPDRTSPKLYIDGFKSMLASEIRNFDFEKLKKDVRLDNDLILGNAVSQAPVVLGYVFLTGNDGLKKPAETPFPSSRIGLRPQTVAYRNLSLISAYRPVLNVEAVAQGTSEGFFNVFPDPSGIIRKVPLLMKMDGVPYPSLALETVRTGLGLDEVLLHISEKIEQTSGGLLGISIGDRFVPTDDAGQFYLNYRGAERTFPYFSACDILDGKHGAALEGKFVLIGTSAAGLFDQRTNPFSSVFPGVEVHATIIDNVLANDAFTHDAYTEIGLTYTLIIAGGLLLSALLAYTGPLVGGLSGLIFIAASVGVNYRFFFLSDRLVGTVYPLITVVCLFLAVTLFNYFVEDRQKRFIHSAFSHYVSPQIVSQLIRSPEKLSLTGEQRNLTILFADIRGFTSISEKMDTESLGKFMNAYLTAMSDVIMAHDGTVDKFIGDAVMAIWGAPLNQSIHAVNGVNAALEMLRRLEESDFSAYMNPGMPPIAMGVGINSGTVRVGNFGSNKRFDYTVIGDNVNLASRLEGLTKVYGVPIIISEFTRGLLEDRFSYRFLDRVRVKGKEKPVKIYEPIEPSQVDSRLRKEIDQFELAMSSYGKMQFEEACRMIENLTDSRPHPLYRLYLERIEDYRKFPPPPDWDGVFVQTTK